MKHQVCKLLKWSKRDASHISSLMTSLKRFLFHLSTASQKWQGWNSRPRVNQEPPKHHRGWMVAGQEVTFPVSCCPIANYNGFAQFLVLLFYMLFTCSFLYYLLSYLPTSMQTCLHTFMSTYLLKPLPKHKLVFQNIKSSKLN